MDKLQQVDFRPDAQSDFDHPVFQIDEKAGHQEEQATLSSELMSESNYTDHRLPFMESETSRISLSEQVRLQQIPNLPHP